MIGRAGPLKSCLLTEYPAIVLISHEFLESLSIFFPLALSLSFLIFRSMTWATTSKDTLPIIFLSFCHGFESPRIKKKNDNLLSDICFG